MYLKSVTVFEDFIQNLISKNNCSLIIILIDLNIVTCFLNVLERFLISFSDLVNIY